MAGEKKGELNLTGSFIEELSSVEKGEKLLPLSIEENELSGPNIHKGTSHTYGIIYFRSHSYSRRIFTYKYIQFYPQKKLHVDTSS